LAIAQRSALTVIAKTGFFWRKLNRIPRRP
jgi:hypothetical protein